MTKNTDKSKKAADADLDDALDQSFPTSDPPAQTNPSQGTKADGAELDGQAKKSGGRAKRS
jgi:hypothetical protein